MLTPRGAVHRPDTHTYTVKRRRIFGSGAAWRSNRAQRLHDNNNCIAGYPPPHDAARVVLAPVKCQCSPDHRSRTPRLPVVGDRASVALLAADGRVRVAHRGGRASAAVLLVGRLRGNADQLTQGYAADRRTVRSLMRFPDHGSLALARQ